MRLIALFGKRDLSKEKDNKLKPKPSFDCHYHFNLFFIQKLYESLKIRQFLVIRIKWKGSFWFLLSFASSNLSRKYWKKKHFFIIMTDLLTNSQTICQQRSILKRYLTFKVRRIAKSINLIQWWLLDPQRQNFRPFWYVMCMQESSLRHNYA